jgi:hypothetical protein
MYAMCHSLATMHNLHFRETQSMLGFIPVENFIGKGTKADYVTKMMIISASGCKQQTSLKMHIC